MAARLLRTFEVPASSSWEFTSTICHYTRLYGAHIVLLTLLSAMTVYRREMSCNHVYTEGEQTPTLKIRHKNKGPIEGEANNLWDECADELLEGAGNYCSGEPLLAVALSLWAHLFFTTLSQDEADDSAGERTVEAVRTLTTAARTTSINTATDEEVCDISCNNVAQSLPPDVQVHILSYLHPKDVVNFASVNRSCRDIVDSGDTSTALWKSLWERDYAWIVHSWDVGRQALERSQCSGSYVERFDKQFYFFFGQAYVNYVLAGHNSVNQCLVGLHGHIYDLTSFLHIHPGSPDTLMIQAGKDATRYFEDMNHSSGARRLAKSMCVVVDAFCFGGCGLHPTLQTVSTAGLLPSPTAEAMTVPMGRRNEPRRRATLQAARNQFSAQEALNIKEVTRRFGSHLDVLSHVNVYYDPFCREWKAWYTNTHFQTTYVHEI